VGSRSKINLAYIAGFIDGDGSLMLQIKKRLDTKSSIRFMATICLYQDTRHEKTLCWIRDVFEIGYLSRRKDGISELRINGFDSVYKILTKIKPYMKFKKIQTQALLKACDILRKKKLSKLSKTELKKLVELILLIQGNNYSAKNKKTKRDMYNILGLTP
jgi:hypothetical protein